MFDFDNKVHGGVASLGHKLRRKRCSLKGVHQISWRVLPLLVVASLLLSMASLALPTPTLAQHEGEQTAAFLPSDTDLYFTVNLDPGGGQSLKFWTFLNNWWQDPNVQAQWDDLASDIEDDSNINIVDDIFPWLGPEIAMGMRNLVPDTWESPEPEMILFIGTMDEDASDAFFFDKLAPFMIALSEGIPIEEVPPEWIPEGPETDYRGIGTLYSPEMGVYWAFPDEYIIYSNNQAFLEESLDLILTPNPSASLAGTSDFQDAQSALPERVGMFYCNLESIWNQVVEFIPEEGELEDIISQALLAQAIELLGDYVPSCFAASLYFGSHGISTTVYFPLPEGIPVPTTGPDLLRSTEIVPGDAWLFASAQDLNAGWQQIRSLIAENWEDMVPGGLLPPGIETFDDAVDWIAATYGVNIDTDIFGWMTGEHAFALLPLTPGGQAQTSLNALVLYEVEDTSEVEGHLTAIIDLINHLIGEITPEGETPDLLETSTTSINGVDATLVTNDALDETEVSLGWLFLDVDNTHYLVIGTTADALEAAVKASKGEVSSLDEAEEYQGILSLLPQTKMSLGYLNPGPIFDEATSLIPPGLIEEWADPDLILSYLPLQRALGFSHALIDSEAITISGALYMLPPPLTEQSVEEGTTATVEIAEQAVDFSQLDTKVGSSAVSMDIDIIDAPEGANIKITAMKELPAETVSGFELAATDAGVSIVDIAYGVKVDKTGLAADNIGTATITMKVGKEWADNYGTDNIKIFRVSDGTREMLPTEFTGYTDDQAVFVGTSEDGLSYFALAAISGTISEGAEINWALIGGIIGGVIVIAALVAVILLQRRRTAA